MNAINQVFGKPLVISLARRQDRKDAFADNARKHKFEFDFFSGVEVQPRSTANSLQLHGLIRSRFLGPDFPINTHYDQYDPRTGSLSGKRTKAERAGMTGCRLSHLEAMQHGYFIMEDDVLLRDNWEEQFSVFLKCGPAGIPNHDELLLKAKGGASACSPLLNTASDLFSTSWLRHERTCACGWAYVLTETGRQIKTKHILSGPMNSHWDVWLSQSGYYKEAKVIRSSMADMFIHCDTTGSDTDGDRTRHGAEDEEQQLSFE